MGEARARKGTVRRRLGAWTVSLCAHAAIVAVVLSQAPPARFVEPAPIAVELVQIPPPPKPIPPPPRPATAPTPAPAASKRPAPAAKPAPARIVARVTRAPAPAELPAASEAPPATMHGAGSSSGVSEAELAGAARAGSGQGGSCDMARRLQTALRKDPAVRAALSRADRATRAIRVWDGDWVQTDDEDGKGLAIIREAIVWEVGFAPPACRAEPVRGLVLLSLNEGPGASGLVLGHGQWRWSDLLKTSAMR